MDLKEIKIGYVIDNRVKLLNDLMDVTNDCRVSELREKLNKQISKICAGYTIGEIAIAMQITADILLAETFDFFPEVQA